jgi:hypothetical protein
MPYAVTIAFLSKTLHLLSYAVKQMIKYKSRFLNTTSLFGSILWVIIVKCDAHLCLKVLPDVVDASASISKSDIALTLMGGGFVPILDDEVSDVFLNHGIILCHVFIC